MTEKLFQAFNYPGAADASPMGSTSPNPVGNVSALSGTPDLHPNIMNNVNNNNNNSTVQELTGAMNQITLNLFSMQARIQQLEKQVQCLTLYIQATAANNSNNNNNNNATTNTAGMLGAVDPSLMETEALQLYQQQYMAAALQLQQQQLLFNNNNNSPAMSPNVFLADNSFPVFNNNPGGAAAAGQSPNSAFIANNNHNSNNNNNNNPINIDPVRGTNEILERVCLAQPNAKEINLKGCRHITSLAPLMNLKHLWRLNLQSCVHLIDNDSVKLIAQYNRRLSRLNLCGCERLTDATPLSQLTQLFDLNLSGCPIKDDSLEEIARHCSQLSRLAINSCPALHDISCLRYLKMLKLLYCRYSANISTESIAAVLLSNGGILLTLNIDGLCFPSLAIASMPAPSSLNFFNLKDNTELTSLSWFSKELQRPVGEVWRDLEMLDVEGCTALEDLASIHELPKLKILKLSKTKITVEEFRRVVLRCPQLTTLSLDGCPFFMASNENNNNNVHTPFPFNELAEPLSQLKKLFLDISLQDDTSVEKLKQTRPQLEIVWVPHAAAGGGGNNNNNNRMNNTTTTNLTVPNHFQSPGSSTYHSSFTTPTSFKVPPMPTV